MLLRFDGAPPGLVTRRGLAAETGYSERSIATVLGRHPEWPGPVGQMRVGRVWVLLYDLEVMLQVMPSAAGSVRRGGPATISDDDGVLTCMECGRRYRALGTSPAGSTRDLPAGVPAPVATAVDGGAHG